MLPLTCYNCGKPIGEFEQEYEKRRKENKTGDVGKILNDLGITKICCRYLFMCSINECKLLNTNKN